MSVPTTNPARGSSAATTLVLAGVCGALGVAVGAFGGHGLEGFLESRQWTDEIVARRTEQFEIGVHYHLVHAVALLGLAALERTVALSRPQRTIRFAAGLMAAGILLFSGSLYALVLTGETWLGAVTPLGGLCWIAAWSLLALAAWQLRSAPQSL